MNEDHDTEFGGLRRTRRNLMAMAAVAGAALLVRARSASAQDQDDQGQNSNDQGQNSNDQGQNSNDQGENQQGGNAQPQCFLRGMRIETVDGLRKVEELSIGDVVPTVFGGPRPIQWIGINRFKKSDSRKPWAKSVCPIRVARSALGPCTPHADLFLTQAHALYIDGVLVRVGSLVNGMTIAACPMEDFDELEFFHIKLQTHDVIFAEGAACETLLTVDEKASNFADYLRLYRTSEGDDVPCLPILSYEGSGRKEMKSRLRSALSPFVDRRQKIDIIRDHLEERAFALAEHPETVS